MDPRYAHYLRQNEQALYPDGGGTVGVANEIYNYGQPAPSSQPSEGTSALAKGLGKYGATKFGGGQVGGGDLSSAGRANAFTGMGGQVGGGGLTSAGRAGSMTGTGSGAGGMGVGGYAAAAAAMAALIKGGNKLNIGANNQMKWYRRAISDSNEKKIEKLGQALKFWKWGG
jgi:hypothetical protein